MGEGARLAMPDQEAVPVPAEAAARKQAEGVGIASALPAATARVRSALEQS